MKLGGKEPDPGPVGDASPSWDRERASSPQRLWLVILLAVVHAAENNSLCLSFVSSGVLSVVKMWFFSVDKANRTFKAHRKPVWARVRCLFSRATSLMRREEVCSLHCSAWDWSHSSEKTLGKDLVSVHNSKDAQGEFRVDLFPI